MKENQLSNNSILVVNKTGIYRLFCPFKATCIQSIESYTIGQEVAVIQVKMDNNQRLIYVIQNKGFYHHYFIITSKPKGAASHLNTTEI